MRKAFVAVLAALASMSVSAHSADIYEGSLKDAPVAYTPAPIWAGLYVGGHIGGLWNKKGDSSLSKSKKERDCYKKHKYTWPYYYIKCNSWSEWSDWEKVKDAKIKSDETERSLLGGVHVGYNWQDGAKVYGLEGDVSFAKGINYLASLRARLGHAVDNTLFYGTAGIAFAGFKDKTIDLAYGDDEHSFDISGDKKIGLVVGGGIERKLASNVSIGLEGLYYFFGDSNYSAESGSYYYDKYYGHPEKAKKYKFTHEDDNDLFVVRARLNYHLQRDEPTLDSYK